MLVNKRKFETNKKIFYKYYFLQFFTNIYVHHLNDWLDKNANPGIFSATELVLLGTSGVCAEGVPDFFRVGYLYGLLSGRTSELQNQLGPL